MNQLSGRQTPGFGVLAQLVEHHNGIVGVSGSNPLGSTKSGSFFPVHAVAATKCGAIDLSHGDLVWREFFVIRFLDTKILWVKLG